MTFDRRLARIDQTLTPTQLVLRWLAEAHAYESLEAYVSSILDAPGDQQPIDRLCREAYEGAQARLRGKPADQVRAAVRSALRETVFRFELVLRIYVTAHELLDREELTAALFASQLALLAAEEGGDHQGDDWHRRRLDQCRRLTMFRVDELLASRDARSVVEARYLDGHPALFPDVAAAFEKQLRSSEEVAAAALRLAELDGLPAAPPPDPEAFNGRVAALVADLVEPAKAEALEKLGEGSRAFDIAMGWVRKKFAVASTPDTETTTLLA
jgi:hypothetical protein